MDKQRKPDTSCGSAAMPCCAKISGVVSYSFNVNCPYCDKSLNLNEWPYDDDQEDYAPAEDELGLALFGRSHEPAKWNGLEIKYKCYHCKSFFIVGSIEI